MDALEKYIMESRGPDNNVAVSKAFDSLMLRWEQNFGSIRPAYVEHYATTRDITNELVYIFEIDGWRVRIDHSSLDYRTHPWDFAESSFKKYSLQSYTDFEKQNITSRYLKIRRRRLKKRGLYNG